MDDSYCKYVLLFVISFVICYWLFKCGVLRVVCVCVCVCVCERERETGSYHSGVYSPSEIILIAACVCVCVCVCVRERERQGHIIAECTARQKSS